MSPSCSPSLRPDEFVSDLAALAIGSPALGIAAPHLYPFGGFDRLFDWLEVKLPRRDSPPVKTPVPLQRRSW